MCALLCENRIQFQQMIQELWQKNFTQKKSANFFSSPSRHFCYTKQTKNYMNTNYKIYCCY